ncbi:tetratricopeptide repeat protein [Marinicella sp. W31]|uniref:tetratricopeptide repeat protein n=1 Tax=Marinicella sp. W31 TaxID=3023713 RepID=UPI00375804EC
MTLLLPGLVIAGLQEEAGQYYQNSQWQQAAESYQKLLEEQGDNQQAWYRLAHAHIELKQGQLALDALNKLPDQSQVPAFMLNYRKAQAYLLLKDSERMWQQLDQAAANGFSLLNNVKEPFWDSVRNQQQFSAFSESVDKNARPCLYEKRNGLFDFWLGNWAVYGNLEKQGPLFGHNHIEKIENGCLIMEHWKGARGSTGTSMNYYDGVLDKWVQNWVSAGGTTITTTGGIENGSMVLTGKIFYVKVAQGPQVRDFRGTWTLVQEGIVRQFFEESIDGGKTWYTWFEGFYFKQET